jgi:hypothetical protein
MDHLTFLFGFLTVYNYHNRKGSQLSGANNPKITKQRCFIREWGRAEGEIDYGVDISLRTQPSRALSGEGVNENE